MNQTKKCSRCQTNKELTEFCKDNSRKDKLYPSCKECQRIWKENNKERIKETSRIWKEDNKERIKEYQRIYQKNRPYHLCKDCNELSLKSGSFCLYHTVKCQTNFFKMSKKERHSLITQLIQKLKDQDYKCYFTGVTIYPSINASLDHLTPKSKGGSNDISNLVWCDSSINRMKMNKTEEEFLSQCSKQIAEFIHLHNLPESERIGYLLNET